MTSDYLDLASIPLEHSGRRNVDLNIAAMHGGVDSFDNALNVGA